MPLVIRFVVLGVVAGLGYLVKKSTEKEIDVKGRVGEKGEMTVVVTPMVLRLLGVLIIGLVVWGLRETRKPDAEEDKKEK